MAIRPPEELAEARERWTAWFEGSLKGGPIIHIEAPLDSPRRVPRPLRPAAGAEVRWTCLEYRLAQARNRMDSRLFAGDAVPSWFANLGPGSLAAFLGPRPGFSEESIWFREYDDTSLEAMLAGIRLDPGNDFLRLARELARRAIEEAEGDYLVSLSDLGGDLDILASLRGSERLLVDFIEDPLTLALCRDRIGELWMDCYRDQETIIGGAGQVGRSCWIPAWYPRPWSVLQCDLSVMLSPAMFDEFALPELARKTEALERTIYHLDGPGEWRHLDSILSLPGLDAIQYVSLPGDPPNEDPYWLPKYRKIAEAGKGIIIFARDPRKVAELAKGLPAERLAVILELASEPEARACALNGASRQDRRMIDGDSTPSRNRRTS